MNNKRMEQNQQAPPAMEAFEQRLLLAGNVLAEVTNAGDLIITGDDAANSIVVGEAAGVITITRGDADTEINGDADAGAAGVVIDGTFSRHIKIKMGDGDDDVVIDGGAGALMAIGGNVQIDLGKGAAAATQSAYLYHLAVAGSLKITSKDDNDADAEIQDFSTVGKNVQIDLGGGDNYAGIVDTTVGGNVKIANKDGEANVSVDGATVDGSVSITNGKGLYDVDIDSSLIGKNLSIKNKELVIPVGAPAGSRQQIGIYDTDVVGGVKISNGKGATLINIDDFNNANANGDSVTIGKNLQISSKDGNDEINVYDTSAANIKISTGKGGDAITAVNVNEVTTTGSLAVANKSGATLIEVWDTSVAKKTKLTGGKAVTIIDIQRLVATGGLQIKGGGKAAGVLDVMVRDLDGGKVSIQGGGDADVITLNNLAITSLQIKTDKGADIINIELVPTGGAASTVGTLKLSTGDGDDTVTIGIGGSPERGLILTGKGNLNGGKGTDTLNAAAARGNTFDEDLLTIKDFEAGDSIA